MVFGLYGSEEFGERAMLLIPNQAAERKIVPKFPGSRILSKYTHLFLLKFTFFCFFMWQTAAIPAGVVVDDIFLNSCSDMILSLDLSMF